MKENHTKRRWQQYTIVASSNDEKISEEFSEKITGSVNANVKFI